MNDKFYIASSFLRSKSTREFADVNLVDTIQEWLDDSVITIASTYINWASISVTGAVSITASTTLALQGTSITLNSNSIITASIPNYTNNAAALSGGAVVGSLYADDLDFIKIVRV